MLLLNFVYPLFTFRCKLSSRLVVVLCRLAASFCCVVFLVFLSFMKYARLRDSKWILCNNALSASPPPDRPLGQTIGPLLAGLSLKRDPSDPLAVPLRGLGPGTARADSPDFVQLNQRVEEIR